MCLVSICVRNNCPLKWLLVHVDFGDVWPWELFYLQVMWLVITKVWSASFGLVLHAQHIFTNSSNFLITWGLPVTVFYSTCIFCVYGMALYIELQCWQDCSSMYACTYHLFDGTLRHLVTVITTLLYCDDFSSSSAVPCAFYALCNVFEVRASSSSPRLPVPLCKILFLLQPPLLS